LPPGVEARLANWNYSNKNLERLQYFTPCHSSFDRARRLWLLAAVTCATPPATLAALFRHGSLFATGNLFRHGKET
jgi:hypothetical protein